MQRPRALVHLGILLTKEVFLKNPSLRESELPVDSPIDAEATSAAFEIELSFTDSVSEFEARERHGRSGERLERLQGPTPRLDSAVILLDDVI